MRVSAIMPTYNQAEFIKVAIDSVVYQVDELIVVNDGSTDGTRDYIRRRCEVQGDILALESYSFKNYGTASAINRGYDEVVGDLVTWVSSDNIHAPHWRSTLEAAFTPETGVAYSAYRYGIGPRRRVHYTPYDPGRLINDLNCFFGPSFLIRKSVWDAAGSHRGRISHDYDHWLRVEEVCWEKGLGIVSLPDCLCEYRVHPKRVTITRRHEFDAPHWQEAARKRRSQRQAEQS